MDYIDPIASLLKVTLFYLSLLDQVYCDNFSIMNAMQLHLAMRYVIQYSFALSSVNTNLVQL